MSHEVSLYMNTMSYLPQLLKKGCLVLLILLLRKKKIMNLDILPRNINHLPKCNLLISWLTFDFCGSFFS